MKKIFSFLLSGVLSLFIYASGITIGGKTDAVDTVVHSHDIGPGTKYAFYDIPAYPLKFHVMEVDLTNPYVDIETCLSGDKAVATETPSRMSLATTVRGTKSSVRRTAISINFKTPSK